MIPAETICEVVYMYEDLHALLIDSDSCREYFMKLPVYVQLTVHQRNDEIRTEEELHKYVDLMTKI